MNNSYIDLLFQRYKNQDIVVDANLLLVYFLGTFNPQLITEYKRTKKYTLEDFENLSQFIKSFNCLLTTPNILTEVSNLSTSLEEQIRQEYFKKFKEMVTILSEKVVLSSQAVGNKHFEKYGLTDAVIIELCQKKYLVLTDDFPLSNLLSSINIDVINFNHIRDYRWSIGQR
ncbi:MAG: PIN domain-containing protein [bacterium]|nr:PIN domain-containing protein [bacterium]